LARERGPGSLGDVSALRTLVGLVVLLVVGLVFPEVASAKSVTGAETRVGVSNLDGQVRTGVEADAGARGHRAFADANYDFTSRSPHAARGPTVIGKVKDLKNLRAGENTLLKHLPDRGGPKANWKQNAGVLRQERRKGRPIRDASVDPKTGELIDYPGSFLNAERNLLRQRGWTYDPGTTLWSPPQ
jgi:hypothetical protein